MKTAKIATVVALVVYLCGCASWRNTTAATLAAAGEVAKGASGIVEPHFRDRCGKVALTCHSKGDTTCTSLVKCQQARKDVNKIIISVHGSIVAGYSALVLSEKTAAQGTAIKAINLIADLNRILKTWGYDLWKL